MLAKLLLLTVVRLGSKLRPGLPATASGNNSFY